MGVIHALATEPIDFRLLPNPLDIGFVGSGSALGAVLAGLFEYFFRGSTLPHTAQRSALGGLAFGTVAFIIWAAGLIGLQFE